jgi:hypothetical protein
MADWVVTPSVADTLARVRLATVFAQRGAFRKRAHHRAASCTLLAITSPSTEITRPPRREIVGPQSASRSRCSAFADM